VTSIAVAAAMPIASAAAAPLVDELGRWSIARMGAGAIELPVDREVARRAVEFRLPRGARQGPRTWYLIRLRLAVELAPSTGRGTVLVSGSTNGRAAAQVEIEPRLGRGSRVWTWWSTVDLLKGFTARTVKSRRVVVNYLNYLQDRGVRRGLNRLTFQIEQYGKVRLSRAVVLPASGLEVSRLSPAQLDLDPIPPASGQVSGDVFPVGYRVRNSGDRVARRVAVEIESYSDDLAVEGPRRIPLGAVGGQRAGDFRVRASRPGKYQLGMRVSADNANQPVAPITVSVGASAGVEGSSSAVPWPVVAGLLAFLLAAGGTRRRRRSRDWA
jgi:hypothetical protein